MNISITNERGFTLLEVLVAFSIFTVSLGILFQIIGKGTRSAMLSDEYNQAIFIAQSRLAGIGIENKLDVGEYRGDENEIYHWVIIIRPHDTTDYLEKKYGISQREVEIEVNWKTFGKMHSVRLDTLKLIPTT